METHYTLLPLLRSSCRQEPLMLLVMGKDVDGEVLAEGFESGFNSGGSDEMPVT